MKTLLTFIAVLFVGCGKSELEAENKRLEAELEAAKRKAGELIQFLSAAEENNKNLKDDLRRLEVVGTYEFRDGKVVAKLVILENGDWKGLTNGKLEEEGTWKIVGEEILLVKEGEKGIYKIQSNGDLTGIGRYDGEGNRKELPKSEQVNFKKIK